MRCRISRHWKWPKVVYGLFVLEFPFTVAILALFGIASPNLYRNLLWKEGSLNGWNSDPSDALYAAANYKPYTQPVVWSQFTTNFNLVISVLSMFLMITKVVMQVVHAFIPVISIFVHAVLVALYAVSVRNQTAPDLSSPKHPNHGAPWYITRSCSVSSSDKVKGFCQQAKASFFVTVIMLAIFAAHLPIAIYSMLSAPPPKPIAEYTPEPATPRSKQEHAWIPLSPTNPSRAGPPLSPMTPRSNAYYSLGGEHPGPAYHHQIQPPPASYYPAEKTNESDSEDSHTIPGSQGHDHYSQNQTPYLSGGYFTPTMSRRTPGSPSSAQSRDLPLRNFSHE